MHTKCVRKEKESLWSGVKVNDMSDEQDAVEEEAVKVKTPKYRASEIKKNL